MMAVPKPSTTRRRVLGAAVALPVLAVVPGDIASARTLSSRPGAGALWNRRLALYRRLAAEAEQAATTGWFRAPNDRYAHETAEIEKLGIVESDSPDVENRIQHFRRV